MFHKSMDKKQHIEKLPNAPLQEVIFELLWEMDTDERGVPVDYDFDFAQGVFAESLSVDFKYNRRTVPKDMPFTMYPKTIHQFWKGENEWPVVQIGPGILVVNDIEKNYRWNDFKKLIQKAVNVLIKSYKKELKFIAVSLKYIDAVEIKDKGYLEFINENFNLNLNNHFKQSGNLIDVNINETFNIYGVGDLNVLISNGVSPDNLPSIIWQSNVLIRQTLSSSEVLQWVEEAHKVASNHFKDVIKEKFYAGFIEEK